MSQSQGSILVMWQQQNEEEACGRKMLQKQQKKQNFAYRFKAFRDH